MVTLGLDMFSLRSQRWTPQQQLEFCAKWGLRVVHYSEVRLIGGLEPAHLRDVRARANDLGIGIELGMLSICPTSVIFNASAGAAEDQIIRMLESAARVGSPFVRCVVGTLDDRRAPGGIQARIDDTLAVLSRVRSRVTDSGLKLAVENHAGDMQARELKGLVEAAGSDWVGVCLDAGNPAWAIEDLHLTLEVLAPYVLTCHLRDTAVWNTPEGAAVQWPRMGEGNVRIEEFIRSFARRCPGRTLALEIIVLPAPRVFRYCEPGFWDAYPQLQASEFARFLAHAQRGRPMPADPEAATPAREVEDLEASLRWIKAFDVKG